MEWFLIDAEKKKLKLLLIHWRNDSPVVLQNPQDTGMFFKVEKKKKSNQLSSLDWRGEKKFNAELTW